MRKNLNNGREYELEAEYGLPEKLPEGEYVIWQGAPEFWGMAKDIFYIRPVIAYFVFLVIYRIYDGIVLDHTIKAIAISAAWMLAMSLVCVGLLAALAYYTVSSTAYTMTNRRVVMRIGIAMQMSFNLPYKEITSADFTAKKDGSGHIPLKINADTKIAYFHLWPHVRPMNFNHPEPMLRNIKNVEQVATLLTKAWSDENQIALQVFPKSPMIQPDRSRQGLGVGLTNDLSLT
jgi:hypothetical protein